MNQYSANPKTFHPVFMNINPKNANAGVHEPWSSGVGIIQTYLEFVSKTPLL